MIFFLFLPLPFYFFNISLRELLAPISHPLHQICLNSFSASTYIDVNQAIVCGENLKNPITKQLFIDSGLYHLIVVSGSHLVLLGIALEFIMFRLNHKKESMRTTLILMVCFLLYSAICNFEPPLVRACFAQLLLFISRQLKLNLTNILILVLSIFLCLSFEPKWNQSMSLLLSATASLTLILTRNAKNPFSKQFFIYIILSPLLFGWGNLHPVTILMNILIAPLISFLLLPIVLLTIPFPFLTSLLDSFYQYFFICMSSLSQPATAFHIHESIQKISIILIWIYFLILSIGKYFHHLRHKRDPL